MLKRDDPRYLAWVEVQGYTLLKIGAVLIVTILPAFHFILGWLPNAPPDSLGLRLAAAGVAALALALARLSPRVRAYSAPLMVVVLGGVVASTTALVVDTGNHPMYVAAGLLSVFGAQLLFIRARDLIAAFAIALTAHLAYANRHGYLSTENDAVVFAIFASAALIAVVLGVLRIRVQEKEFEGRIEIEAKSAELTGAYEKLQVEQERSEALLLNILPGPVAERLKAQGGLIADHHPAVSVLFADIVGFTRLTHSRSAEKVVFLLNDLFTRFDRLAQAHGVEKIKTIGDAYMAAAGLPTPRGDHAHALAALATGMLTATREFSRDHGELVEIRIGLNTGPVVAGVIGERKFIYDLWGDTVNIASRMESHGLPGEIHVTEAFRDSVGAAFVCEPRGLQEVKGKGALPTFLLRAR